MDAMTMRMPFTFIVEADGPIGAADRVMESQHMDVVNVEPLLRRRSSVQRVRGGVTLWKVTAIDPEPVA